MAFFYKLLKKNSITLLFSICYLTIGERAFAKVPFVKDEAKGYFVSNIGENNLFELHHLLQDTIYRIRKVVIDAGHGGKDSGCIGYSKKQEKDITLKIALALGRKIKAEFPNITIIYTRDKDVFIPLDERADIANKQHADLFISIHCNFLPGHSSYQGSETFVLGLHKTKENLEVARRENAVVMLEKDYGKGYNGYKWDTPEANIIINAWQASYLDRSMKLATEVEKNLTKTAKRKSRGVKQAGFLVLRATTMPSILVETGFLSNPEEERFLNSVEGQNQEAEAIFKAFSTYKKNIEDSKHIPIQAEIELVPEQNEVVVDETPSDFAPKVVTAPRKKSNVKSEAMPIEFTAKGGGVLPKEKSKTIQFKVQLTTSPSRIATQNDAKWNQVTEVEIRKENGLFKYLASGFDSYEAALQAARQLNTVGFAGAFVVAYEGEERIDVKLAKEKDKLK